MATLKIYPGCTGMQKALTQIQHLLEKEMQGAATPQQPRDPLSMLAAEEQNQARGRRIADLLTAQDVLEAHQDGFFLELSQELGRERFRAQGGRRAKSCGWSWTCIRLRGGLSLELETPYLRCSRKGKRGRKRKKRGSNGSGLYPVLCALGFKDKLSPATRSEIARQSVLCSSYEEARDQLRRHGLKVGVCTIVRAAVNTGKAALELRDRTVSNAIEAPLVEHSALAGKRVRISLDGGRARTRRTQRGPGIRPGKNKRRAFTLDWKEPRLMSVDILDEDGEKDRSFRPVYETIVADADSVMELVQGTLRLLGVHKAQQVLFVADGADWIWRRIVEMLIEKVEINPERLFVALDYYHATKYISDVLKECKNLQPEVREALRKKLSALLLKPSGAKQVIEELRPLARGRRARAIKRAISYLQDRLAFMDYYLLRSERLCIGSGVVESAIRRVLNLRFKSASMCWRKDHLEPLLYLRANLKAGRWDEFFHSLLAERHWVHPMTTFSPLSSYKNDCVKRLSDAA